MTRIALIAAISKDDMSELFEEIGLCSIASSLRLNNIETLLIEKKEEHLDYDTIYRFKPDLVGITIYEKSKSTVYSIAKKIKEEMPDITIIVGGPYATYCSSELLREAPFIDCAIRGEGELTFLQLVGKYEMGEGFSGIDGVTYREKSTIIHNGDRELINDLDILPNASRDILTNNNIKVAQISTSRGCIGRCSFCISQLFWKKYRSRDIRKVIDEIEFLNAEKGIKFYNFIDGSFEDPDPKCNRIKEICKLIISRKLDISYIAAFRADFYRKADEEIIRILLDSGLCGVNVGIEAGNEFDLKLYKKNVSVADNLKVIDLFKKNNITIGPGFINFNPYSTFEGLKENIQFLQNNKFSPALYTIKTKLEVYKGTEIFKQMEQDGLIEEEKFDMFSYKFLDSRIEYLANYVNQYISQINTTCNGAFDKFTFFTTLFPMYIFPLKRHAKVARNDNILKIFEDYDFSYNMFLDEINDSISNWYKELIVIAEKQWSNKIADEVSNTLLNEEYIKSRAIELSKLMNKLQISLLRQNKAYADNLISLM